MKEIFWSAHLIDERINIINCCYLITAVCAYKKHVNTNVLLFLIVIVPVSFFHNNIEGSLVMQCACWMCIKMKKKKKNIQPCCLQVKLLV